MRRSALMGRSSAAALVDNGGLVDATSAPAVEISHRQAIPNKLFFRIGEVSQLVGVEAYVLRYWETEFPSLSPKKSPTGQRMFRRKDVELLLEIKHLLYDQKFTIEGARKSLQEKSKTDVVRKITARQPQEPPVNPLSEIRRQLSDILEILR